jgi:hypothetical protein
MIYTQFTSRRRHEETRKTLGWPLMLEGSFASDVLSKAIAGVVAGLIIPVLTFFFRTWVRENLGPLLVGFLSGSVLTLSIALIFLPNSSPPTTQPTVQGPPQVMQPSKPITESPYQIYQWYQQFKSQVYGQEMAAKKYYGNYVEWEFAIKNLKPEANGYVAISSIPEADRATLIFCVFSKDNPDIYTLEIDKKAIIRGTHSKIEYTQIHLTDCKVLKFL